MGSRYDVEVTILSAHNLKNVNWRNGDLRPYAVAWIDTSAKCSTKVDIDHDTDPEWDEKLTIPLPPNLSLRDGTLYVDIVHANAEEGTKPLVGSARLPLSEVVDEAGIGGKIERKLKLKRPSGRPQGKLEVCVAVKEPPRYYPPPPATAPYGQPYGASDYRDPYGYALPVRNPYGAPSPGGYPYAGPPTAAPPSGYPYGGPPAATPPSGYPYGGPPAGGPPAGYPYGGSQPSYGQTATGSASKSKFGMGTGLAVGAAAGILGGLALAEGVDYVEDKIADDVADKVEDDFYEDDF
ncbi:hypothetical protein HPP92_025482 [Vanilla planifolia]|uniref:C2 domain-containing protein n=1 Tax=Vanilla planifolia TaxID=51239 RepID=A0A835UAJ0_VANPL|nr:hypothetical protein HPP92_025482 [Vanilla planifolia]